jgi:hypothetical protein
LSGAALLAGVAAELVAAEELAAAVELEAAAALDVELFELLPQPTAMALTLAIVANRGAPRNAWRTLPTVLSPH